MANIKSAIFERLGIEKYKYLSQFLDLEAPTTFVVATNDQFNIDFLPEKHYKTIVNIQKINDLQHINQFFQSVNSKLEIGGTFVYSFETFRSREYRIFKKYPRIIAYPYYILDFIFKRIFPKLPLLRRFYFFITLGRNRVLSKTESLGRVVSCGFKIVDYTKINNLNYCIARKVGEPETDIRASYQPIIQMPRIGKGGKIIRVFKFRTMHPFAEYLQDYVLHLNGYSELGKPANDFRLTPWGRFLRKYWLDELPQLINVLRGEMNLVGIRPLSRLVFDARPKDLAELRIKYKPGCIPPYVALLMPEMEGTIEAERIYFTEKKKNPYTTDIKYFIKAVYNILSNKIRSA